MKLNIISIQLQKKVQKTEKIKPIIWTFDVL